MPDPNPTVQVSPEEFRRRLKIHKQNENYLVETLDLYGEYQIRKIPADISGPVPIIVGLYLANDHGKERIHPEIALVRFDMAGRAY